MEAIEEPLLQKNSDECITDNSIEGTVLETSEKMDICTSNGDTESVVASFDIAQEPQYETTTAVIIESDSKIESEHEYISNAVENPVETENSEVVQEVIETEIPAASHDIEPLKEEADDGNTAIETEIIEESVEVDGVVEENAENISFETEIFIENNTAELEESYEEPDSSNILSELGQDIELSDVLRSTDVSETVENNNCEQEVFNKEELLDILEGNDTEESHAVITDSFIDDSKKLEEHLAMQQLNRLKVGEYKKKSRNSPKKPEKKLPKRNSSQSVSKEKLNVSANSQQDSKDHAEGTNDSPLVTKETRSKTSIKEVKAKTSSPITSKENNEKVIDSNNTQNANKEPTKKKATETTNIQIASKGVKRKIIESTNSQSPSKEKSEEETITVSRIMSKEGKNRPDDKNTLSKNEKDTKSKAKPKKENIVSALVQDWSDEEPEKSTVLDKTQDLLESTEKLVEVQQIVIEEIDNPNEIETETLKNTENSVTDEVNPNRKSLDESQPQRRLGRVIKKKIIYDPDNPDTFTKKSKVQLKKDKEDKEAKIPEIDTDMVEPKKIKTEQSPQIPKVKSPVSKMQWKKPQAKNNKQSNRRLTEIDKLLMDEGAVNMICQLTPDALKGNKNMKSKAEYIKNIQSNTPDTKEMKFRERKSKVKTEESESKKVGNSKQRLSLNSSIKSPAASDDFENHSADDSIIYRRHSSSSYSSSCMSPRRLSDVDGGLSNQSGVITQIIVQDEPVTGKTQTNTFMSAEKAVTPRKDIMNKSDCLSIKEKLNSKLSLALNKRKLSSFSTEKPTKLKKVASTTEQSTDVTLTFNQKVAEICIRKTGSLFNVQIMKALKNTLLKAEANQLSTVTLITSESGTLCTGLDLKPIIEHEKHAHDIADQARSLMLTLESHSKLLLIGVEGKVQGFSLALAALSDVLLASENCTFSLTESSSSVIHPGAGVLSSKALTHELVTDLIVFGRSLSAAEALRGGLVSRVVWPERFHEQARAIAADLARQPAENIRLKKELLGLKKTGSPSTFQAGLDKERDLLVNYWTSDEGLDLLRASNRAA